MSSRVPPQSAPRRLELGWLLLLDLLLLSPVLVHLLRQERVDPVSLWVLATSALWLLALQLLVGRAWVFTLLLAPLAPVVLADLFLALELDGRLNASYLSVALTNLGDTRDFFSTFARPALAISVSFAGVFAVCGWQVRRLQLPWDRRWGVLVLALLGASYVGVTLRQARRLGCGIGRAALDVATHDTSSPFGILPQAWVAYSLHQEAERQLAASEGFRFEARLDPALGTAGGPQLVVLVIGESARPDHWGLNGYARDTTPRLARIDGLVSFSDMLSTACLTQYAVPMLITRATPDRRAPVWKERSLVTAFKEVGYRTAWLSTQEVSHWGGLNHRYALNADEVRYLERRPDGALVEPFEELLAGLRGPDERWFVVLHTMGSHFDYATRCPADLRVFPDDPALSRRDRLLNAYDDSVRYTDHVLAEPIGRLQARPDVASALLYVSDHGENLLDDERQLLGHGQGTRFDLAAAACFWASPLFSRWRGEAVALARARATAALSATSVFHSLADLVGIRGAAFDRSQSLFAERLAPRPRWVLVRGAPRVFEAPPWPDGALTPRR